jgi:hypothetical protein
MDLVSKLKTCPHVKRRSFLIYRPMLGPRATLWPRRCPLIKEGGPIKGVAADSGVCYSMQFTAMSFVKLKRGAGQGSSTKVFLRRRRVDRHCFGHHRLSGS